MTGAEITLIIYIIGLVAKYGPDIVQSAMEALGKDVITLEDIRGLKITKQPEDFGPEGSAEKPFEPGM